MALDFLNQTPVTAYRKLEQDIALVNPNIDMRRYKSMTPRRLDKEIEVLETKEKRLLLDNTYGSWLADERFAEIKLLKEALVYLREYKTTKQESEVMVPGFTYYRGVKQFGPNLIGEKCYFVEGKENWTPFKLASALAKAIEITKHGSEDDFKRIYVELANGRPDSIQEVTVEHLTESSENALKEIEEYCDGRWTGPWPWEMPSPYTLRIKIEDNQDMRNQTIAEMQGRFNNIMTNLQEGEMEQFEVIQAIQAIEAQLDNVLKDLGKISGEQLLTLKDNARTSLGDAAADQIDQALTGPINDAADAISRLRASVKKAVTQLEQQTMGGMGNGMDDMGGPGGDLGGDLGSPMDALGGDLGGDDLAGQIADVDIDGDGEERPKKSI